MTSQKINIPDEKNVHDKFFRKVFGNSECVAEFLKIQLPEVVREKIKFDTLTRKWDSYIDGRLKNYFTDIIFHTELETSGDGYIVCLFEHKSTVEKGTALQIFKYMARLWDDLYKGEEIPLVLPVVFYHGKGPWAAPQRLSELFPGKLDWIKEAFPDFKYFLFTLEDMITRLENIELAELRLYITALRVVNSTDEKELERWYQEYVAELDNFAGDEDWKWDNLVIVSLLYILMKAEYSDSGKVIDVVARRFPERRQRIMTVAEKLREEGRKEGKIEGKNEAKKMIARRLLELDEEIDKIMKVTGLSKEEIESLQ